MQEVIRYQEMTAVPLAGHGAAGLINLRGEVVTRSRPTHAARLAAARRRSSCL